MADGSDQGGSASSLNAGAQVQVRHCVCCVCTVSQSVTVTVVTYRVTGLTANTTQCGPCGRVTTLDLCLATPDSPPWLFTLDTQGQGGKILVFVGPPCSGKGTQAKRLAVEYNFIHLR
jgi:hypothetical protein